MLNVGSPTEIKTSVDAPRRMPMQRATTSTQARIASSVAVETVDEATSNIVQRSAAPDGLRGTASRTSAAVAGGARRSTSISTKARLAEDTLNAIEVVQSNRLGYAAVAAGAGALLLGVRNRRNSKKEL
jgi:hypothetical protein